MLLESNDYRLIAFFILLTVCLIKADIVGWIKSHGYAIEYSLKEGITK